MGNCFIKPNITDDKENKILYFTNSYHFFTDDYSLETFKQYLNNIQKDFNVEIIKVNITKIYDDTFKINSLEYINSDIIFPFNVIYKNGQGEIGPGVFSYPIENLGYTLYRMRS
jgi:hypothetical protein